MRLAPWLAAITLIVACSSSDDENDDDNRPPKTPAEAFTKRYCEVFGATCCPRRSDQFWDLGYCRVELDAKHAKSTDAFNQDTGDNCIAALEAAKASATFCDDNGGTDTTLLCNRVFRPAGEPETVVVSTPPDANEGEACDGPNACGAGLFCDEDAKTCTKQVGAGEPCANIYACRPLEAFCGTASTCIAWVAVGGACALGSTTQRCAAGAYCDTATNQCAPLAAPGGPCTKSEQCPSQNSEPGVCSHDGTCLHEPPRHDFCPTPGD